MKHFWIIEKNQQQTENLFTIMEKLCVAYKFFAEHHNGQFTDFYRYACNINKVFETFQYKPNRNDDKIQKATDLINLAIDKNNQDTTYLDYWNYLCEKYEVCPIYAVYQIMGFWIEWFSIMKPLPIWLVNHIQMKSVQ